jgi:FAD-linked sulfhydryl oxidase
MPEDVAAGVSSSQPLRTTKETHPHLPPGLILGPDGKPCKVCNSWQDWAKLKTKKKSPGTSASQSAAAGGMAGFAAMMAGSKSTEASSSSESTDYSSLSPQALDRKDCPPDTALLGRSTWTFLHTTAAYYPIQASLAAQERMSNLISSLSFLYPCVPCADDFRENVKASPPDLSGREGFSRWLCERHNEVNVKLGKPKFDCDWSSLNRRWKDGPEDGSCD